MNLKIVPSNLKRETMKLKNSTDSQKRKIMNQLKNCKNYKKKLAIIKLKDGSNHKNNIRLTQNNHNLFRSKTRRISRNCKREAVNNQMMTKMKILGFKTKKEKEILKCPKICNSKKISKNIKTATTTTITAKKMVTSSR